MPKEVYAALAAFAERNGIHRRAFVDITDEAHDFFDAAGPREVIERLRWIGVELAGASMKTRGGRAIGMLRSATTKVIEKSGARVHTAAR